VRQGTDIREKVQDLTLAALRGRPFDRHSIREVVRAVTEGAVKGTGSNRAQMREAMSEMLHGLDQALRVSAEAGQVALKELTATGRAFSGHDLKIALSSLRRIEDDFVATVTQVADGANAQVRPELREALREARQAGTATGRQVAGAMGDFAQKFSAASFDAALTGLETAGEFGQRFAMVASGVLGGLAEALRTPKDKKDPGNAGAS
jgi:AcrR family transcriptional regulator